MMGHPFWIAIGLGSLLARGALIGPLPAVPCSAIGPVLTIGGLADGANVFGNISDATLLPDSGVAVLDRQAKHIRIYDGSGHFVRAFGRGGEGPGEFKDPIEIALSDAGLAVWDWGNRRVTTFDLDTDSVETVHVPALRNPQGRFGIHSSGGFVFGETTGVTLTPGQNSWMMRLAVLFTGPSGRNLQSMIEIPDREAMWVDKSARRIGYRMFTPEADMAVSAGKVWVSRGDSARVLRISQTAVDTMRWNSPPQRVRPTDVERRRREILERSHPARLQLWRREFESLPVAEFFPVVAELAPDTHGGVWIGSYARPGDPSRRWLRMVDEGVTCEVDLPASFTVVEGGETWILGVATDELDVQRLELWTLVPTSG